MDGGVRDPAADTFVLRPARVYGAGPFTVEEGVVAAFTRAVADNLPLRVRGSGRQKMSLIHIDDLCGLLARLLKLDNAGSSAPRPRADLVRVHNACSESGITVDQLADAFIAAGTGIGLPRAVKCYAGLTGLLRAYLDAARQRAL